MGTDALRSLTAMNTYQGQISEFQVNGSPMSIPSSDREAAERMHHGAPDVVKEFFSPQELWHLIRVNGASPSYVSSVAEQRRDEQHRQRQMAMSPPPLPQATSDAMYLVSSNSFIEDARAAYSRRVSSLLRQSMNRYMFGFDSAIEESTKNALPDYSGEKFESMGKEPVVKEIMAGAVQLTKEQAKERIQIMLK